MARADNGMQVADLSDADEDARRAGSRVCPFSDESSSEDDLGAPNPDGVTLTSDPNLGSFSTLFAGRNTDDRVLEGSSSGGLTSWILGRLLEVGAVDGVIHVGRSSDDGLFSYRVSYAPEEISDNRKSAYYSTSMDATIASIRGDGLRYAVVGVPCFITAMRHVASSDDTLDRQLVVFVGLVCGHLKSSFFAESLAWQVGVAPGELSAVDFRIKDPDGEDALQYKFGARTDSLDRWKSAPTPSLVGGNWGMAAFQPEACNFCDDIFAETADVALGDAWLPQYRADWRGTNVVVSRNALIDELLADGMVSGQIQLESITPEEAAESQAGNFRHRRTGLAVRLADDRRARLSIPSKRVAPDPRVASRRRRRLIRQRRKLSRLSFETFAAARASRNLDQYLQPMRSEWEKYRKIESPLPRRLARRARATVRKIVKARSPS